MLREFGDRVTAIHRETMKTLWHLTFHLRNRDNPALDYKGSVHQSYLRFLEEVEDDIRKTIEDASSLKREDLEKILNEKTFCPES